MADGSANKGTLLLPTVRASQLASVKPTPIEYVDGHNVFVKGDLNYLSGAGAIGKTTLMLQLASAVGLSENLHPGDAFWLGRPVTTRGPVMIVSAEESVNVLHLKLLEVCAADVTDLKDLSNVHIHDISDADDMALLTCAGKGKPVVKTPLFDTLMNTVKHCKPSVIIIDNRAQVVAADENDRNVSVAVGNIFRRLATRHSATVILLTHPSMSGMKTGSSGSTGWNTTTRNSVFMRKPNSNDEDDDAADDGKRELYMSKANYGPQGRRIGLQWAHGVYECTDKPPRPDADIGAASKAERVFLKLLDLCNRRGQPVTSNRAATKTFAPNVFFDSGDREGVTKPALEKAMNALLDRAEIINVKTGSGTREKWHLERAPAVENSNPR